MSDILTSHGLGAHVERFIRTKGGLRGGTPPSLRACQRQGVAERDREREAEQAERGRQEAERQRRRMYELNDAQVVEEYQRRMESD